MTFYYSWLYKGIYYFSLCCQLYWFHKLIISNPILQFPELLTHMLNWHHRWLLFWRCRIQLCNRHVLVWPLCFILMLSWLLQCLLRLTLIGTSQCWFLRISLSSCDKLPQPTSTSAYRHSIELLPDAPLPKSNPFTLSLTEEEEVTTQIDKLLELEHIVPSTSSLASLFYWLKRKTVLTEWLLITENSIKLLSTTHFLFCLSPHCLPNLEMLQSFPN